ncbi:MAG: hypothetical protein ACETVZ_09255 [Phycisphaerae bacterium]
MKTSKDVLALMKRLLFCVILILLSMAKLAQTRENNLGLTLDITYVSKYMDKGFDVYDDHGAIKSGIDIDVYGSGFGINVTHFRADSGGFENDEKIDYTIYYYNGFFEQETYATNYKLNWIYHHFPDQPPNAANTQEIETGFSWPNILSVDIVPSYTVCYEWPAGSSYDNHEVGGWAHIFALKYDLAISSLLPDTAKQLLHLSVAAVYNDGLGGPDVDHDWSHMVLGVSTEFELIDNLAFTPAIFYQSSWDDSVNSEDECWMRLSLSYAF